VPLLSRLIALAENLSPRLFGNTRNIGTRRIHHASQLLRFAAPSAAGLSLSLSAASPQLLCPPGLSQPATAASAVQAGSARGQDGGEAGAGVGGELRSARAFRWSCSIYGERESAGAPAAGAGDGGLSADSARLHTSCVLLPIRPLCCWRWHRRGAVLRERAQEGGSPAQARVA
jgi:hypothetical protein